MKHKTAELEGELLDKAAALALGGTAYQRHHPVLQDTYGLELHFPVACAVADYYGDAGRTSFSPSRWWEHGGPIIDAYTIHLAKRQYWFATIYNGPAPEVVQFGPTPLIAAMRAFVASKLGEEVEIPC